MEWKLYLGYATESVEKRNPTSFAHVIFTRLNMGTNIMAMVPQMMG